MNGLRKCSPCFNASTNGLLEGDARPDRSHTLMRKMPSMPSEYSQTCSHAALVVMGQLRGWTAHHAALLEGLLAHLLNLQGTTHAWRREIAERCGGYPIYLDMGGAAVLRRDGSLGVAGLEPEDLPQIRTWVHEQPALASQWLHFAWDEGCKSLPKDLAELKVIEPAVADCPMPAADPDLLVPRKD